MKRNFRSTVRFSGRILFLLVMVAPDLWAQREVLYEQYRQNPMGINPAFTGVREDFNLTGMFRRRWFTLANSPVTQSFAMDGTVANNKIGIGFQALNDRMSPFTTTGFYGSLAFHYDAPAGVKISAGAQGGINVLPVYDGGVSGTRLNRALGSFGLGVWAQSPQFYAGISMPELLRQQYGTISLADHYDRPLFITGGARIDLNTDLFIIPSGLVQVGDNVVKVDLGGRIWYHEQIGAGVFYQTKNPSRVQLSLELMVSKNVRLGYVYNSRAYENYYTLGSAAPQGMHELILKFVPSPSRFHIN